MKGNTQQLVYLTNVIDSRTGKFHPVAIVYEENAKYYHSVNEQEEE